ncbi:MAG: hypothetical protein ACE5H0_06260 [Bacteroidota bacterium]
MPSEDTDFPVVGIFSYSVPNFKDANFPARILKSGKNVAATNELKVKIQGIWLVFDGQAGGSDGTNLDLSYTVIYTKGRQMNSKQPSKRRDGERTKKRVLIYSQDPDFCISLTLLFQEEYDVTSTTLLSEVAEMIGSHGADLLVADSSSSLREISRQIEDIKKREPAFPVVLLYVYRFENRDLEFNLRRFVNALFYKPIDITHLSNAVHSLLANH